MKKNSIYQILSFGAVSLAFMLVFNAAGVQAATIDVVGFTDGAPQCNNTNQADDNLRSAICYVNANAGDHTINLPAGTYTLSRTGAGEDNNSTGDLDIKGNVTITGAGAGSTIIDAGDIDRIFHIFSGTVILQNLTIQNGTADWGGGVRIADTFTGTTTINDCIIGCPTVGCTLGNTATNKGGGLHNGGTGTVSINNSIIASNTTSGSTTYGGGISHYAGIMTITSSTVQGNTAQNSGGGIYVYGTTPQLTVDRSAISGNIANGVTVNTGLGGGIYQVKGTVTLNNCTLSGNSGRYGGGVYLEGTSSALNLNYVTVTDNDTTVDAGGLRVFQGTATVNTSIIAENTTLGSNPNKSVSGTLTSDAYSIIGTISGLNALAGNGGATQTHALDADSSAVDAIPNGVSGCGSTYTIDQRSYSRPSPSGGKCDVGAYEYSTEPTPTPTPTPDPNATATPTPDPNATATPTPDATATPTVTPTPTPSGASLIITLSSARITEGNCYIATVKLSNATTGLSVPVTLSLASGSSADLTIGGGSSDTVTTTDGIAEFTICAAADAAADEGLDPSVTLTASTTTTGYDPPDEPAQVFIRDNSGGPMTGDTLTFPSFVLYASYDWLHNFYDNNTDPNPASTNPRYKYAADNFNKLIMIDSNLFPIYTALQGDFEMPNVTMRNWTSGVGLYSPSVNDYMNRSVAAAANYINTTSKIFFGYGSTDFLGAVGMRSYMQWVYALDPANNNFRRYKFVKIADVGLPPYLEDGLPDGDVAAIPTTGDEANIGDCDDCDVCHWYVGESSEVLCGGGSGTEVACCPADADVGSACYADDQKWIFMAKRPGQGCSYGSETAPGGSAADMPACNAANFPPAHNVPYKETGKPQGAPYYRVPVAVKKQNVSGGDVTVRVELTGFSHDAVSGLVLELNRGISGCEVEAVIAANSNFTSGDDDAAGYIDQPKDFNLPGSADCADCTVTAYQDFTVPLSCATEDQYTGTYDYMYVDIYPCDGTGIVLQVPGIPEPKDNAFRIPIAGLDDVDTSGMTAAQIAALIESRWAKLSGYLDVVPPESYPGYYQLGNLEDFRTHFPNSTTVGYGFQTNTSFSHADNVRFKDPRDIALYRDYFDQANGGPVYIFVADTMNSRIQVFMNATGSAGEPGAAFPIRPVRVKGPNDNSDDTSHKSNELGMRIYSSDGTSVRFGDGRKADWRQYTTLPALDDTDTFINISAGKGEFYYPHSIAVDQDPDTKDVYLFVADTFNHRIQVFRDVSGVSSQDITAKQFDFEFEAGLGTYPLQTSEFMTDPGAYNFRYPKGLSVARFSNNSSYLYVVDSKDYRLMKYEIGEDADGISSIKAVGGYGYDGSNFVKDLHSQGKAGQPMITYNNSTAGFWNPQDVATGYSGFFNYTSPHGKGTKFLNNYMIYVTDYARNMTSITRDRLNMRVMQFIEVPGDSISGTWIPWRTQKYTNFAKGVLGQSVYGIVTGMYSGSYRSVGTSGATSKSAGTSNNVPGRKDYFTDRPVGITALHWNTLKPLDIRIVDANGTGVYLPGASLSPSTLLRIGVSSRKLSFGYPESDAVSFVGYSTEWSDLTGDWDATDAGRVHLFCYDEDGKYIGGSHNHANGVLEPSTTTSNTPYIVRLSDLGCTSGGFVKIIAEDESFDYSARTGTVFYRIQ